VVSDVDEVGAAVEGELRLMDPAVRTSRSLVAQLLDPDFVEVGASGKRWTYEERLAALPDMQGGTEGGHRYEASGMTGVLLAPGLVHLTYETAFGGDRALRSSIWRRERQGSAWRMLYHQATPAVR
jgi:hypothetical protein